MAEKISVIIPVYNVDAYLERCLRSIVDNTYKNLEIICVNDGSTDRSGLIMNQFAEEDSRIVTINKRNGGVSSARNAGLDVASGEYIAFVDSDDWVHPQYFEILISLIKQHDCDLAICGYVRTADMLGYKKYDINKLRGTTLGLEEICGSRAARAYVWGKIYRAELIRKFRFFENVKIEDVAFNGLVLGSHESIRANYVEYPLYYYFQRTGSLVSKINAKDMEVLADVFAEYLANSDSVRSKRIYTIEILKRLLAARYLLSITNDRDVVKQTNEKIKMTLQIFWNLPNCSFSEYITYYVFYRFPAAYRVYRIALDPTLVGMEKRMKEEQHG